MAEDQIEQHHGHVGIGGLSGKQFQPQGGIDHRVRPADGELVVTEIDDRVTQPGERRKSMSSNTFR